MNRQSSISASVRLAAKLNSIADRANQKTNLVRYAVASDVKNFVRPAAYPKAINAKKGTVFRKIANMG